MFEDQKLLKISLCLSIVSPIFIFLVFETSPWVLLLFAYFVLLCFFRKKTSICQFLILVFFLILSNLFTKDISIVLSQRKIAMIGEIEAQRGECLKIFSPLVCRLYYNKVENFFGHFFGNFISHFSLNFLFLDASSASDFAYPKKGIFYFWELPLFLLGLSKIGFKESRKYLFFVIFPVLVSSLFSPGEISAFVLGLPFVLFIESFGWLWLDDFLKKKKSFVRNMVCFIWVLVVLLSILSLQISLLVNPERGKI